MINPHYRLCVPRRCRVILFLENPVVWLCLSVYLSIRVVVYQELSVNLRLFKSVNASVRQLRTRDAITSGAYRPGCCSIDSELDAGVYTLVLSTFKAREAAPYQLICHLAIPPTEASEFTIEKQMSGSAWILPNGHLLKNGILRILDLHPLPVPYQLRQAESESVDCSNIVHSSNGSFLGLFRLDLKAPVTEVGNTIEDQTITFWQLVAQLNAVKSLPEGLVPSLTLFYIFTPPNEMFQNRAKEKGRRALLQDLGFAAPERRRYRRWQPLIEGWSSEYDPSCHRLSAIARRSDLEGGTGASDRHNRAFSTAAEQFYIMNVSKINFTFYNHAIENGHHVKCTALWFWCWVLLPWSLYGSNSVSQECR